MNEALLTSSSWRGWRSRDRLNHDSSRWGHQPSAKTTQTKSRWVYDRRRDTCRSRLETLTAAHRIRSDITGQFPFPLAIAEPLIKCTPVFGVTGNDDATAMSPVLHQHTNIAASPSGTSRIPSSFSDISPQAPPAPPWSRSSWSRLARHCSSAGWRSTARGTSCVCSQPTGGFSEGEIGELRSGMGGRRWKGDSKIALSSPVSTS